jgi:protoheme IX farnesyltransferase
MSSGVALIIASLLTVIECITLYNPKTAMFGAISIFLYTSIYTLNNDLVVCFVGAFRTILLCWLGCHGQFGIEAGTLFLIQFFGSFHFWAIGWFCMTIMRRLVSLCCLQAKDKGTALQIILYTVWLILASLLPVFGYTGVYLLSPVAAVVVFLVGIVDAFFTQ